MTYHCLFEQSGTFKNVLKDNGHTAYDYDILNDFGETDFVIDLFGEIDKAYDKLLGVSDKPSIFDDMSPETDFIIAFFPCTYFCDANSLIFRRYNGGKRLPFDLKCSKTLIKRNANRARFFELYIKFCAVCQIKGLKAIIENPASGGGNNYLALFSPIDISYTEKDRTLFGDVFSKPTNFFAINFEMKEAFIMFAPIEEKKTVLGSAKGCRERSMISRLYAENFYERFLK